MVVVNWNEKSYLSFQNGGRNDWLLLCVYSISSCMVGIRVSPVINLISGSKFAFP